MNESALRTLIAQHVRWVEGEGDVYRLTGDAYDALVRDLLAEMPA